MTSYCEKCTKIDVIRFKAYFDFSYIQILTAIYSEIFKYIGTVIVIISVPMTLSVVNFTKNMFVDLHTAVECRT